MTKRKRLQYVVALALLTLPFLLLRANLRESKDHNWFERGLVRVASPIQAAASWTVNGIGGIWSNYIWLVDVAEENRELRGVNDELRFENAALTHSVRNVSELEDLVKLRRQHFGETVGARVVAASVNPFFRVLRIRLLKDDANFEKDMPVISHQGLVGRVQASTGPYADVLLLTDPQSSVDVKVVRTGGRGVLTGTSDSHSYATQIEYLEKDQDIKEGDEIVTSGLGGAFPPGLHVGFVSEISKVEFGLYQKVTVLPSVDMGRLEKVLVLLAPPPPPDPDAETLANSLPAFGLDPF